MTKQKNLPPNYIIQKNNLETNLHNFVTHVCNEKDGRYKSWEYCYDYFQKLFKKENPTGIDKNYAALILGFFLASWGMLRNSFLLNCTYTVHQKAIDILLEHKLLLTKKIIDNEYIEQFFGSKENDGLKQKLEKHYIVFKKRYQDPKTKNERITQVLVSKIIMGISGLVPAYDRYVVTGLRANGFCQTFNETSYKQLLDLYKKNKKQIKDLQTAKNYKKYPPMKILDIYLWEEGRKLEEKKKKEKRK